MPSRWYGLFLFRGRPGKLPTAWARPIRSPEAEIKICMMSQSWAAVLPEVRRYSGWPNPDFSRRIELYKEVNPSVVSALCEEALLFWFLTVSAQAETALVSQRATAPVAARPQAQRLKGPGSGIGPRSLFLFATCPNHNVIRIRL